MTLAALVALSLAVGVGSVVAHPTRAHVLDVHAEETHAVGHFSLPESGPVPGQLRWAALVLFAGLGLLRLMARCRRDRLIAFGLSLVLSVFTLETAVHSVHHLDNREAAAACSVLSTSQHLCADETPALEATTPPLRAIAAAIIVIDEAPRWHLHRPHYGRAPPA